MLLGLNMALKVNVKRKRLKMHLFKPDEYYVSVLDIDLNNLKKRGVKGVLLDLDNTILPRTTYTAPDNLKEWVQSVKDSGFKICCLSNNFHDRVIQCATDLDVPLLTKCMKPFPLSFFRGKAKIGNLKRKEVVVIGDQFYTDILGAHLSGIKGILVTPLVLQDLKHTKILRKLDHFVLRGTKPLGGAPAFVGNPEDKPLL